MSPASAGGTGGDPPGRADVLFADFLREAEEGTDFEDFLQRNSRDADALRALHSLWIAGEAAGPESAALPGPTRTLEDIPEALRDFGGGRAPPPAPGQAEPIPGYRLGDVLGEGGFGIVYRAEQVEPIRRTVAIKVIRVGMVTREAVARFEAERQALALMSHPSIATVHEAGATGSGQPFFVMEYIHGEPITDYCEHRDLGVDERLDLFLAVCDAMEHAHQKGVIHRDVKPSNVLVSTQGEKPVPKVIDFGIAKALGGQLTEHTLQTQMGQIIGTPAYMSPEQADISGTDIDTRSDIYSLGVLLYEILTGAPPLELDTLRGRSIAEVLRFVREEEPCRPSTRVARLESSARAAGGATTRRRRITTRRLRGDLDWIVLKAMAKDRDRRYAAVSELAEDIRRHLRHEPVLAGPPSAAYRLRKLARKHRTAVSVLGAGLVLLLGMTALLAHRAERAFHGTLDSGRAAVASRDLDSARTSIAVLLESHPGRREVRDLEAAVNALELELRSEESAALLDAAAGDWKRHLLKRAEGRVLKQSWEDKRLALSTHAPPWERAEELAIHDRLETAQREALDLHESATAAFQRAIDTAPRASGAEKRARTAFALAYQEMQELADQDGTLAFGPDFFRRRGAGLDAALFARRGSVVRISTQPPGAEVHCFRFEEHEKRLLPLPFDPRAGSARPEAGLLGAPSLVVTAVLKEAVCPFEVGDRLVAAEGRPLRVTGDLARAVEAAGAGASVKMLVDRGGSRVTLDWIPFPRADPAAPGSAERTERRKLVNLREQLGFVLDGYPLQFAGGCRLGETRDGSALEVHLPDGSYLLVFRRESHIESRYPLRISGKDVSLDVRLLPEAEVPAGFAHVPAGPFTRGGDAEAFQASPLEEVFVESFLIARHEVTFEEYLEFLNDPLSPIDERGETIPGEEARAVVRGLVARGVLRKEWIDVLPRRDTRSALVRRDDRGRWTIDDEVRVPSLRWPVFGVSRLAAEEYARWLTERRRSGLVARYRLPTDQEWEKAARGADRRKFVWGDYPVWCFAWVNRGIHRKKEPEDVGFVPTDESIYGVRDLTGSVSEHALGQTQRRYRYGSVRGGNWFNTDDYFGRVATRNGILPEKAAESIGFRVVAELRPD